MSIDENYRMCDAITAEAATWRMLRARLPGHNPDDLTVIDVSGLSADELALVEDHLAAQENRRRLLHPEVPDQATRVPTEPPG